MNLGRRTRAFLIGLLCLPIDGVLNIHFCLSGFLSELVRRLPLCPKRRLLFILRRPELYSLSKLPLSRLLVQLVLSAVPRDAALSCVSAAKFPPLMNTTTNRNDESDVGQVLLKYFKGQSNEQDLSEAFQISHSPIGEALTTSILVGQSEGVEVQNAVKMDVEIAKSDTEKPTTQSMDVLDDRLTKWSSRILNYLNQQYHTAENSMSWIAPVSRLLTLHRPLASTMLTAIIPSVWSILNETERVVFSDAIVSILSSGKQDGKTDASENEVPGVSLNTPTRESSHSEHLLQVLLSRSSSRLTTQQSSFDEFPLPFSSGVPTVIRSGISSTQSLQSTTPEERSSGVTATQACRMATEMISSDHNIELSRPLLDAITRCHPPMIIPPSLLHYTATRYGCWHTVSRQLLHQLISLPLGSKTNQTEHANALADVYDALGEVDYSTGTVSLVNWTSETRIALADAAAGRWATSQEALNDLFKKVVGATQYDTVAAREVMAAQGLANLKLAGTGTAQSILHGTSHHSSNDYPPSSVVPDLGIDLESPVDVANLRTIDQSLKSDVSAWATNWIQASTQLNQWNSLNEISSCVNVPLTQDSRAKLQVWAGVEQLVATNDLLTPQAAIGLYYSSLSKLQQQLHPNGLQPRQWNPSGTSTPNMSNLPVVNDDAISARSVQKQVEIMEQLLIACQRVIVANWRELPSIATSTHWRSLLCMQLQVETAEGFRWITEYLKKIVLAVNIPGQPLPSVVPIDSRPLIMTWRTRLLSKSDDMRAWSDLLVWRNCFFTIVQGLVNTCPRLTPSEQQSWSTYQQDVAWTIFKFANVANWPHRLPEVALALLSKLHTISTFFTSAAYRPDYLSTVSRCVKLCQTPNQIVSAMNLLRSLDINQCASVAPNFPSHSKSLLERALSINPMDKLRAELSVAKARVLAEFPNLQIAPDTTIPTSSAPHQHMMSVIYNVLDGGVRDPKPAPSSSFTAWNSQNSSDPTAAPVPFTGASFSRPNNVQDAFSELSAAIHICPVLASPWATWANLSDRVFTSPPCTSGGGTKQPDVSQGISAVLGYLMATYLR